MRLSTKSLLSISGILLLLSTSPIKADDFLDTIFGSNTCGPIVDNYLDAVGEFQSILETMIPLSTDKHVTDVLKEVDQEISKNNITYNAMQSYDGAIHAELKKHPNSALNEGMSQLDSQLSSLHTRVDQWKKTDCREKHACDLGEPGYCSKKH